MGYFCNLKDKFKRFFKTFWLDFINEDKKVEPKSYCFARDESIEKKRESVARKRKRRASNNGSRQKKEEEC